MRQFEILGINTAMVDENSPLSYVKRALRSIGLSDRSVKVTHHSPETFGNFVAIADTQLGKLRIVYDRGFCVDPTGPGPVDARKIASLLAALDRERRSSH